MKKLTVLLSLIATLFILGGCIGAKGNTKPDKISNIQQMRKNGLAELYKIAPSAKQQINSAYGYAIFDNTGINLLLISTGKGYGVAHNNKTGKDTYMKMFSAGVGVGLGVKDFRGIFVFENKAIFNHFVNKGWSAGGQADAAAKWDKKGGAIALAIEVSPGIHLYQITKKGLAAQATIQGTKFWKDKELN